MDNGKTILILGGGIGGVVAATRLREKLPREHRVVLIEREQRHLFQPSLLWLMVGQRDTRAISRPLTALDRKGIEPVQGNVERIDPAQRAVRVNGQTLNGDALVIALGVHYAPDAVPGLTEAGQISTRWPARKVCARRVSMCVRGASSCWCPAFRSSAPPRRTKRRCC
jgi:sulfide:quinone oxidoreductase